MITLRTHWRAILARLSLPMLALAASHGVYTFALLFVPFWVALVQAAAFELTYIGLAVVQVDDAQRRRARLISIGAVVVSILYNTLSGFFHLAPSLLLDMHLVAQAGLAVLHGAPLAWLAFLVADLLLHQRGASVAQDTEAVAHFEQALAQRDAALVQSEQVRAQLSADAAQLQQALATRNDGLARAQATVAQLEQALAQAGDLDVRSIAQALAARGATGREIARVLGRPESTVRTWTRAAIANAAD